MGFSIAVLMYSVGISLADLPCLSCSIVFLISSDVGGSMFIESLGIFFNRFMKSALCNSSGVVLSRLVLKCFRNASLIYQGHS